MVNKNYENSDKLFGWQNSVLDNNTGRRGGISYTDSPYSPSKGHFLYNVVMDFSIVLLVGLETALVVTVSMLHFLDYATLGNTASIEKGALFLFPIFYNFIGVIWFLSDKNERSIIERLTLFKKPIFSDLFQIPVLGPFFTTLSVFIKSLNQNSEYSFYQRLEASATKMRQAITFFSSAPEAVMQLSLLILEDESYEKSILEIITVFVAVFAMAEANVYQVISVYFRLFRQIDESDIVSWKIPHTLKFPQKTLLFLHAFFSIATNIISRSLVAAFTMYHFKKDFSPTFITLLLFVTNSLARQIIYYMARVVKHLTEKSPASTSINTNSKTTVPTSYYEAVNYGWRATILNFDYTSDKTIVQIWFYVENAFGFGLWFWGAYEGIGPRKLDNLTFIFISSLFGACFLLSIVGLLLVRYYLRLNALQTLIFNSKSLFIQNIVPSRSPSSVATPKDWKFSRQVSTISNPMIASRNNYNTTNINMTISTPKDWRSRHVSTVSNPYMY